ncbi:hypothetical protein Trydic_g1035 [Trypoxylus dichotomus]
MDHPVPAPRNPKNINLRHKQSARPPRKQDIELLRKPTASANTEDIVKNRRSAPGYLSLITKEYHANATAHQGTNDFKEVYRKFHSVIDQKVNIPEHYDSTLNRLSLSPTSSTLPAPLVEIKPWRSTKN